jgi:glycosyltransferase involved in cell wall biosynthesis
MGAFPNPLRVAVVLPYLAQGGTEGQVLELVRRIDRKRFDPRVVALGGGGGLEREFRALGVPVEILGNAGISPAPGAGWKTATDSFRCVGRLAALFRKEAPGIVHAWLPAANALAPLAARIAGARRIIVGKRTLSDYKARHRLAATAESFGNRLADVVLVNSDAVRRDVERTERHWEGKVRKIHNGVAPVAGWGPEEKAAFRRREGIPVDAPVVLCVSNFYPYKGHADLVDAIAKIAPAVPEAVFLLVGRDSGTLDATRARVRERGIERAVRFPGSRADVADLLRASDLFVHPSHEEGFSNAILEAMAAGLPVVASDVGGNREAVLDGETGRLVPAGAPAALAAALGELLADDRMRKAMGESGRKRATERFSLDRMVAEMESLYESLARGDVRPCAE